jgi:hypothetical protein
MKSIRRLLFFVLIGVLVPLFGLLLLANFRVINLPGSGENQSSSSSTVVFTSSTSSASLTQVLAVDDEVLINVDQKIVLDVLANDKSPDGNNFSIFVCAGGFSQPENGEVVQEGRLLSYTPKKGFSGNDKFSYQICSENFGKDEGEVMVVVGQEGGASSSESSSSSLINNSFSSLSGSILSSSLVSSFSSQNSNSSFDNSSSVFLNSSSTLSSSLVSSVSSLSSTLSSAEAFLSSSMANVPANSQNSSSSSSLVVGQNVPRSGGNDGIGFLIGFVLSALIVVAYYQNRKSRLDLDL